MKPREPKNTRWRKVMEHCSTRRRKQNQKCWPLILPLFLKDSKLESLHANLAIGIKGYTNPQLVPANWRQKLRKRTKQGKSWEERGKWGQWEEEGNKEWGLRNEEKELKMVLRICRNWTRESQRECEFGVSSVWLGSGLVYNKNKNLNFLKQRRIWNLVTQQFYLVYK